MADRLSSGFIYLVADNSITGAASGSFSTTQIDYFNRIKQNNLSSPVLIGFGIKTASQYKLTKKYANGAIIGSEFIRKLSTTKIAREQAICSFINSIANT
jgi:tryptophan synthase alpha chain